MNAGFDEPVFRCHLCRDTQWREYKCDGGPARMCGRSDTLRWYDVHDRTYALGSCRVPHTYVDRCLCFRT